MEVEELPSENGHLALFFLFIELQKGFLGLK